MKSIYDYAAPVEGAGLSDALPQSITMRQARDLAAGLEAQGYPREAVESFLTQRGYPIPADGIFDAAGNAFERGRYNLAGSIGTLGSALRRPALATMRRATVAAGPQRSSGPVGRHARGGVVGSGAGFGSILKDRDMGMGECFGHRLGSLAVDRHGEQFAVDEHRPVARGVAIGFQVAGDLHLHQKL